MFIAERSVLELLRSHPGRACAAQRDARVWRVYEARNIPCGAVASFRSDYRDTVKGKRSQELRWKMTVFVKVEKKMLGLRVG